MKLPPPSAQNRVRPPDSDPNEPVESLDLRPVPTLNPRPHPALLGASIGRRNPPSSGGFLSKLGRATRGPVTAMLMGAMLLGSSAGVAQAQGRSDVPPTAIVATMVGQGAQLGAPILDVTAGYVQQAQTEALKQLRPEALFDQMRSGQFIVQVPLRAGTYEVGGTKLTVDTGTVMRATVQIKDGRLVPYEDGEGTRVQLTKPIDGPVWTTAHGVFLKDKGHGRGQPMVDVAGWFDKAASGPVDLKVSTLIRNLIENVPDGAGMAASAGQMVDWDNLRFQLDPVHMGDGVVDLGGAQLDLAQGTQLHISGDLDSAVLTAHFALDGAQVRQPGLQMDLGASSVDLRIVSTRSDDGSQRVQGSLHNITGQVDRFVGTYGDGEVAAKLDLKDLTLNGAQLDFGARISGPGAGAAGFQANTYHFVGDVSGTILSSNARLKDGQGTADLTFAAGQIQGHLDASPQRVALDSKLTDARLGISDFQPLSGKSTFDMKRGVFDGDVELSFDTESGAYQAHVDADSLNVVLEDLKAGGNTALDLGHTELTGSGEIWLGPQTMKVVGDLGVSGRIDDLKVRQANGADPDRVVFDVAAGSSMQGRLRSLEISPNAPLKLDVQTTVKLALDNHAFDFPGFSAVGPTSLEGPAHLEIDGAKVRLSDANLIASMTLQDGKVADGEGAFALDLAAGSSLRLVLQAAEFGGADRVAPTLQLGAGSHLEALLDGGHFDIAQRRVNLEPGTLVRFEMASLEQDPEHGTSLIGSLYFDAPLQLDALVPAGELKGLLGDGGVGLRIDGVRFDQDGKLTLKGVNLAFEGSVGEVRHVKPGHERARLATLLAAHPEIHTQQQLINYFFRVGGDWAGASRAATNYGVNLQSLTQDRGAPVHAQVAEVQATPSQLLSTPSQVPSADQVAKAHAGQMLGIVAPSAPIDMAGLAQRVDDGRLMFSIPVQGDYKGVTFEKGTVLYVSATAKDGKLVPDSFSAHLSKPGDATLWTTLRGAYLDDDRNLMLDIGGWFDREVEGFEKLPTDISALVERLTQKGAGGAASGFEKLLDFDKAQLILKDVTFQEGKLPFGVGEIGLKEGTRLTAVATVDGVTMRGRLDASSLVINSAPFALDAGESSADLFIKQTVDADGLKHATVTFSNLELDGRGLVYRSDSGNLAQLGPGQAKGEVVITLDYDADDRVTVNSQISLSSFKGQIEALRAHISDNEEGEPTWVTLGPSGFDGQFNLQKDGGVTISGLATELDARMSDLDVKSPVGLVHLDEARLMGSGVLSIAGDTMSFVDGKLSGAARMSTEGLNIGDVFPGYLEDILVKDGKATFQFDLDHVGRLSHSPGDPFELTGTKGRLGGNVSIDDVQARIAAKPFDSGVVR